MASTPKETRGLRWDLRVAPAEDELVRAASAGEQVSHSSFVRDAALNEARRVLADRTRFELEPDQWREFCELLDRPAEVPAGLRDLFSKPSVFEHP